MFAVRIRKNDDVFVVAWCQDTTTLIALIAAITDPYTFTLDGRSPRKHTITEPYTQGTICTNLRRMQQCCLLHKLSTACRNPGCEEAAHFHLS